MIFGIPEFATFPIIAIPETPNVILGMYNSGIIIILLHNEKLRLAQAQISLYCSCISISMLWRERCVRITFRCSKYRDRPKQKQKNNVRSNKTNKNNDLLVMTEISTLKVGAFFLGHPV